MMPSSLARTTTGPSHRLLSIDALRGLVILIMLLDHVRDMFFLHVPVADPMDVAATSPALFFSRLLAHLCAPVFIALAGVSAWLYGNAGHDRRAVSGFLLRRGLFLVLLELTLVGFAWTWRLPPQVMYLQVIWAIGLSMMALAALVWLPRAALVATGVALVAGHNLLSPLHFAADSAWHVPWAILHDRAWLDVADGLRVRTSYPVLPWLGVIALGYAAGPWFAATMPARARQLRLAASGLAGLAGFAWLRALNGYGQEQKWMPGADALHTAMSFLNVTKYPPSLLFLLLTLGPGCLLLLWLERAQGGRTGRCLAVFGAVPMFFYLLHLYVLQGLYQLCVQRWGLNQGRVFGLDHVWQLWLAGVVLALLLWPAVRWFAVLKATRRDWRWLKYF
ncbi:heparan-alpha-glucosaminide N-acetyltransferase domain-containing protein [Cupriavidus sp. WGtm5]|uniref:DUF1624 domain-containing protein n=1 Tax=Cupriavidus sp. WGtm5 TaxID=2919926 RepID=UPI002091AC4F|nr:heparan-alpha-glucosaminide N-acetyltransferase domain-containing protein [Cupriavidus sp. WGtm5]MCO4893005.1 heparan-alpha-glucosaminide N-acetyltransferase domain-containing protein [Cupriavidus sp. WGtm5]